MTTIKIGGEKVKIEDLSPDLKKKIEEGLGESLDKIPLQENEKIKKPAGKHKGKDNKENEKENGKENGNILIKMFGRHKKKNK